MHVRLQFTIDKARQLSLDYPELVLVALVVVAVKLLHPLNDQTPSSPQVQATDCFRFDWQKWYDIFAKDVLDERMSEKMPNYDDFTAVEVTNLPQDGLDAYFAYISSFVDSRGLSNEYLYFETLTERHADQGPMTQFFPSELAPAPAPPTPDASQAEVDDRIRRVMREATVIVSTTYSTDNHGSKANTDSFVYKPFQKVENLSDLARSFYAMVGE